MKTTPYLVLAETGTLSAKFSAFGRLSPGNPGGAHDGSDTLELHLSEGPPVNVLDAMGPIVEFRNRISRSGWGRTVASVLDAAFRSLIGADGEPIRLLEPEGDFPSRQYVRFSGAVSVPSLPVPYLGPFPDEPIRAEASAEPYGGDVARMTWRSRLVEKGAADDATAP